MVKRSHAIRIGLALAILGGTAYGFWQWKASERQEMEALSLSGSIDIREVTLGFQVGGRVTTMAYEEGNIVPSGAVLARLDAERLTHKAESANAQVAQQQAVLDRLLAGARSEDIARTEAELAAAQAKLVLARLTFARKARLAGTVAQSQSQYDEAAAARDEAAATVEAKRQALALLRNGSRIEDITEARAKLATLISEAAAAEKDLREATLYAPESGVVLTKVVEPGTVIASGTPVYILSLPNPLRIRAYVDEPHLGFVKPGTKVEIITDSRPDKSYHGTVGYIAPTAEFTPKTVHTPDLRTKLVYRFRVTLEDGDDLLRQGMPVTVRIAPPQTATE